MSKLSINEIEPAKIKQLIDLFPDCINDRSKQVINMRYGLNGNPKKTLQQIGDIFGVCRERVRQIEKRALRKLKHPSRLKKVLPDYDKIVLIKETNATR